jgi:CubicO group peptidase (beta-lactamase class C family)
MLETLRLSSRLLASAGLALCLAATTASAFDTRARAAFVVDQQSDTVLLSKNAQEPLPPASMSKLMTLYVAFEALRDGRLTLDERLPVSQHAMSYKGSTMFLNTQDRVRVEDLLRGIIVLSGNDACVVIAEALSPDGTEAGFARYMTERARQWGMKHSTFANSNGWPADCRAFASRLAWVDLPEPSIPSKVRNRPCLPLTSPPRAPAGTVRSTVAWRFSPAPRSPRRARPVRPPAAGAVQAARPVSQPDRPASAPV